MKVLWVIVAALLRGAFITCWTYEETNGLEESPVVDAYSVVGERAFLPCDISSPHANDSPLLILFFRGQEPIYSVDARNGALHKADHWTSARLEDRRPNFIVSSRPHGLVLPSIEASDEGSYHCRVDFTSSPTRNLRVMLHVAVPPSRISVVDGKGAAIRDVIGPYPLGDTLTLTCIVTGGRPRPVVTWWHESTLLDDLMEESQGQMTTNSLTVPNLTKFHLGWKLTCQSVNSNLTNPVMASVEIDMTFPPSEISIEGAVRPVHEQHQHQMSCVTSGSRPPANITWWKDGQIIHNSYQKTLVAGNGTRSTITLKLSREDDMSVIACRAENPRMPGSAIEDTRKLIVFYPPRIHLEPGRNLNLDDITEGDDVYFNCIIEANPKVFRIEWMVNNRQLTHKVSERIILSNQSLVLQRVSRNLTGNYRCKAGNTLGKATSSSVYLNIKYPPFCQTDQQELYGSSRQNPVNITCEVGGTPLPSKFVWSLNSTSELLDLSSHEFVESPGKSVLLYQPKSHNDFGTLFCWGENELGRQTEPCIFQVVPATPPEGPKNCSVSQNVSEEGMIIVHCIPGWDGGLPQTFSLEVRQSKLGPILATLREQEVPTFSVSGLPAGRAFRLRVVSENTQGKSTPLDFVYFTPIDIAEERLSAATSTVDDWGSGYVEAFHLIGVAVGVAVVIVVSCAVVVAVVMTRAASHARQPKATAVHEVTADTLKDEGGFSHNTEPDVILVTADDVNAEETKELPSTKYDTDRQKQFYPKSFGFSASEEPRLSFQETDVLLPTNRRMPTILSSSMLPSTTLNPTSILSKAKSPSSAFPHPPISTTLTPLLQSTTALPLPDEESTAAVTITSTLGRSKEDAKKTCRPHSPNERDERGAPAADFSLSPSSERESIV